MRLFTFLIAPLVLFSCSSGEEANQEPATVIENSAAERPELSLDSKIFFGNRLFSEKTCITCHSVDEKKIGPSVMEIMQVYKEHNASIEEFLKGHSKPIVDTTASQVAIMQANIDGFLKDVTDEELNALATYMSHVDELNTK